MWQWASAYGWDVLAGSQRDISLDVRPHRGFVIPAGSTPTSVAELLNSKNILEQLQRLKQAEAAAAAEHVGHAEAAAGVAAAEGAKGENTAGEDVWYRV